MPVVKELEQYFDLDAYSGQLMSENMNVEESISEEKIQSRYPISDTVHFR